jgi:hypothetical protein
MEILRNSCCCCCSSQVGVCALPAVQSGLKYWCAVYLDVLILCWYALGCYFKIRSMFIVLGTER